jgi:hypothetical protein
VARTIDDIDRKLCVAELSDRMMSVLGPKADIQIG